jgi:hypothetical protein
MDGLAPLAHGRAAGALALALLAGACASADRPKRATAPASGAYAIGPVGPRLAAGDPGALTRWQNQMAEDMRRGRPAGGASTAAAIPSRRQAAAGTRPAVAPVRAASASAETRGNAGGFAQAAPGQTSGSSEVSTGAAAAPSFVPVLTRATLSAPAVRPATAASEAVQRGVQQRWLWAVVAASLAALIFLLGRALAARRTRSHEAEVILTPGPARIETPRRPVFRPGPPPPRVTVLASARR